MQDRTIHDIIEGASRLPSMFDSASWGGPSVAQASAILLPPIHRHEDATRWVLRLKTKRHARLIEALGLGVTPNPQEWRCLQPSHLLALAQFAHEKSLMLIDQHFPHIAAAARARKLSCEIPACPELSIDADGVFAFTASVEYSGWVRDCGWRYNQTTSQWQCDDALQAVAVVSQASKAAKAAVLAAGVPKTLIKALTETPIGRPWMTIDPNSRHATIYAHQRYENWLGAQNFKRRFWHGVFISDSVSSATALRALAEPLLKPRLDALTEPTNLIDIDTVAISDLLAIIENEEGRGGAKKKVVETTERLTYNKQKKQYTTNAVAKAIVAGFTLNAHNKWVTPSIDTAIKLRRLADIETELHIQNELADAYVANIATRTAPAPPIPPAGLAYDAGQIEAIAFCVVREGTLIADDMGLGKAQPLDAKVMTPTGWRLIGDLVIGDTVIGSNGRPTFVSGVYPQGRRPVYRVSMTDGATTRCCDEHLWRINDLPHQKFTPRSAKKVATLESIRERLALSRHRAAYIPIVAPIDHSEKSFTVNPYLLGAVVGAGLITSHNVRIRAAPFAKLQAHRHPGTEIHENEDHGHTIEGVDPDKPNPLRTALRNLGLGDRYFIPEAYFLGSIEQRADLIHGLCQSSGCDSKLRGRIFETEFPPLADQVAALVRSLGGTARRISEDPNAHPRALRERNTKPHQIYIELPASVSPHESKRRPNMPVGGHPTQAFKSIVADGEAECVCIAVHADDQLYVTDDYILTHNTQIGVGVIDTLRPPRTLIITLANNLTSWERHIKAWLVSPPDTVIAKANTIPTTAVTIIANTSLVNAKAILAQEWDLVIIDEAHKFKNDSSQRADTLYDPVNGVKAKRVIDLTGTPIPNKPQDLFNTLHQKLPKIFDNRETFNRLFGLKRVQDDTPEHADRRHHLGLLLRRTIMLRRRKNLSVVKRRKTVHLSIDDPELRAHLSEEMKLLLAYENTKRPTERTRILAAINQMRQQTARYKIPAVAYRLRRAVDMNIPFIVFGIHTEIIDSLVQALARLGVSVITLHGKSSSASDRQLLVDFFQKGAHHGAAGGIKSAGTALTITRARLVVMIEVDWDPFDAIQAEDRAYRRGQMNDVDVEYYVVDGSVDGYIAHVNNAKIKIATQIIDCDMTPPKEIVDIMAVDKTPELA